MEESTDSRWWRKEAQRLRGIAERYKAIDGLRQSFHALADEYDRVADLLEEENRPAAWPNYGMPASSRPLGSCHLLAPQKGNRTSRAAEHGPHGAVRTNLTVQPYKIGVPDDKAALRVHRPLPSSVNRAVCDRQRSRRTGGRTLCTTSP